MYKLLQEEVQHQKDRVPFMKYSVLYIEKALQYMSTEELQTRIHGEVHKHCEWCKVDLPSQLKGLQH